ncbi:MAG TPA: MmgE/PrpD family protein [Solirubrobacterales bacterium]|nr:MmgE/PrpD family protein [Solirubrobacterales bacterium]
MALNRELADFVVGVTAEQTPDVVRERARSCLVHGLVVGAASVQTGFGDMAERAAGPEAGAGARSLVSGRSFAPQIAAHINGTLLQARAQEDTHGTFHAGVVVLPAALAAAEAAEADGETLLDGVIAGYEVGIALASRYTELSTPPHRATGVYGPVAAAAAAARIAGLDAERTAAALSIASAHAGGTTESFGAGTHEWHFQSGLAACSGVIAARLAAAGALGSDRAFEGAGGFLDAYPGTTEGIEEIAAALGTEWGILDVTFKPFPVCAFNQTPALIAARLQASGEVDPAGVKSIRIELNEREANYPGMDNRGPYRAVEETLMSTQFSVATALTSGSITFASLHSFDDPTLVALTAAATLVGEADRAPKTAAIEVELADGARAELAIDDPQSEFSWSPERVRENAVGLRAETHWGDSELRRLIERIDACDELGAATELVDAFAPPGLGAVESR